VNRWFKREISITTDIVWKMNEGTTDPTDEKKMAKELEYLNKVFYAFHVHTHTPESCL
jgi:hypothetical protein